ncbi:Sodium-dependent neutral amino acid transporter B(0)AT3 [Liparis tanakae]|uniref:Sodium-dependent neutral amino acid transporter B(0)AT3 n=1 Tax=Liparis tanakae TaxID=230148 RepID=A0A4Z2J7A1_9TELE|nr:Sodium-dependent neutral amino acid transporter B(0)AT3 [Liparis tanakae]
MVSFLVGIFYNTILAWVLWYFFHSFQNPLPWSQCPLNENLTGYNVECVKSTPSNYFWYRETLNITPDIEISGSLNWWLVICLASAWSVVYICFIKGISSIGKVVYVTATFPYLVLTIFLIRALTLPGAIDGLVYLFTPDVSFTPGCYWMLDNEPLEVLKNPQVWLDAATQIFFSLSLAFGGLIAFSSYNAEKNILALTNQFELSEQNITADNYESWLEYLNRTTPDVLAGVELSSCNLQTFLDQSASGTGLAFIVFTEAVIEMPGSQIWAILFFVMLFSLGLSSMFGQIEGVLTPIKDLKLLPKWIPHELISGAICLISFLTALIFTLGSGNYWVEVFNSYVGSVPLLIIAFFEITAVAYGRGMKTFSEDIYFMTGKRPNIFWKACWMVISPVLLLVVLVAYVVIQAQKYPSYPTWNPAYGPGSDLGTEPATYRSTTPPHEL